MMNYSILTPILAFSLCAAFGVASENTSLTIRSPVGNACMNNEDCGNNLHCLSEKETRKGAQFLGGYCVKFDCSLADPCDFGSKCVEPEKANFSLCLASCSSDTHCRNGYACHEDGVCLPATN